MEPKTLNAIVHDHEAACYDERFAISYDATIGPVVERDLTLVLGERPKARRALDFCCGTGYAAIGMAAAGLAEQMYGCDLSSQMLEQTHQNAAAAGVDVHTALCDGERLPYASGSFDLVVARGALHHLPSPADALREIRRVLEPGAPLLVLAEPTPTGERQVGAVVGSLARGIEAARTIVRRPADEEHHSWELASMAANLHTFTRQDLEGLARSAGFDEVRVTTAWWSWVLVLGLNYYAAGESQFLATNGVAHSVRRAAVNAAIAADRLLFNRLIPEQFRHTVQAVLR